MDLEVTSEAGYGGHNSGIDSADISFGSLAGGYPTPVEITRRIKSTSIASFFALNCNRVGTCLVYHIDQTLGIVPGEVFNRLNLVTIGED